MSSDARRKHTDDSRRRKHLNQKALPGVKCNCEGRDTAVMLAEWQVKLSQRLGQMAKRPGVYPMALIVGQDGTHQLVIGVGGNGEWLGG